MVEKICQPFIKEFSESGGGDVIPLANEENNKLVKIINALKEQKFQLETSVASFRERVKNLNHHTKNVSEDMNQNLVISIN